MRIRFMVTTIYAILAIGTTLYGQDKNRSVVLPQKAVQGTKGQCSRAVPKFDSTWQITDADVKKMESNLSRISQLKSKTGNKGSSIEHPENYYRQYLGIVVGTRRLIYINAFCQTDGIDWHTILVNVCDGGNCYWGAMYDPATGEFFDLQTNGFA